MTDPRYPIGRFENPGPSGDERRLECIRQIAALASDLQNEVGSLTREQLDTPYREGGWTVRQVIHHLADSHMNSYARCKLALTESEPTIKPYDENLWAQTPDCAAPCEISVALLDALHRRWVFFWKALEPGQWSRAYRHPERGVTTLETTLALYAWHGRHHLAHIRQARERRPV